jgi:chemotaxis protein MotB
VVVRVYQILAVFFVTASLLVTSCAVPQQTYDEMKERYDTTAKECDKLKAENNDLRTQNDILSERLKGEAARLASAQDIIDSLKKGEEAEPKVEGETPVGWQTNPRTGGIVLEDSIMFGVGKATLSDKGKVALKKLAGLLNSDKYKEYLVRVDGHTDDIPVTKKKENVDNWFLSAKRAHTVLTELRTLGVSDERLFLAGYGEYSPIAPNAPKKQGSEKNRRVEIVIIKER